MPRTAMNAKGRPAGFAVVVAPVVATALEFVVVTAVVALVPLATVVTVVPELEPEPEPLEVVLVVTDPDPPESSLPDPPSLVGLAVVVEVTMEIQPA